MEAEKRIGTKVARIIKKRGGKAHWSLRTTVKI